MIVRWRSSLVAAAVLAAVPGALAAQGTPVKPVTLSKEQMEQLSFEINVLVSAIQSPKVEAPVKEALARCIYSNNFAKISEAMAKVVAQNAGKVDRRNPDQMLFIMSGVCGYRPQPAAAKPPASPARPAPAKPGAKAPQGR